MTALNTPGQIALYRLATLRSALRLESLGMTRSRSPSALSILRSMGYKGNRAKVLAQVVADVAEATGVKENLNGVGSSHSQPSLSDTGVQVDGEAK